MPGTKLSAFDFRNNAIGFMRLALAAIVLWSHCYDIGGFGFDPIVWFSRGNESAGTLAVAGFFVLSGFLITRSFESIGKLDRYLWHRFLRIFPGYWVCLAVTAFGLALLMFAHQHGSVSGYLAQQPAPAFYVIHNLALAPVQRTIGDIVAHLPETNSLNGSLWTLPVEFGCYGLVGILGTFALLSRRRETVFFAALALQAVAFVLLARIGLSHAYTALKAIEMVICFLAGSSAYLYRGRITMSAPAAAIALAVTAVALPSVFYLAAVPWCFAYCIVYAAMRGRPKSFDRHVDLSYGVYIYAFPVQQLLVVYGLQRAGFVPYLLETVFGTAILALASWFAVERPSLSLKNVRWQAVGNR